MTIRKKASAKKSTWKTGTGITPDIHTICEEIVVMDLCSYLEQGLPLDTALDLTGIPVDSYREWGEHASRSEEPYTWCFTMIRKARASYIYSTLLDLTMADGNNWRKQMEILKMRDPDNWGGGNMDESIEPFDPEFM